MDLLMMSLWALASFQLAASTYIGGCPGPIVTNKGFDVSFYTYPLHGQQGFNLDGTMNKKYYTGGYKNLGGKYASVTGLTDINFYSLCSQADRYLEGFLYGKKTPISNFGLEFKGYYRAPETGEYTIYLAADDEISLQMGRGSQCCGDFDTNLIVDKYQVGSVGDNYEHAYETNKGVTLRTTKFTMTLTKGLYYPIKMVYFNAVSSYVLQTSILQPNGLNNTNWACDVFQLDTQSECPKMTTIPWTGTFTTDTTRTNALTSTTETEIIVETPGVPGIATTVTTSWTGTSVTTSTATGYYTTTCDGTVETGVITSFIIETPTLRTTESWINTATTNKTTPASVASTIRSSGLRTRSSAVTINTSTPALSTTTQPWTGSSTTTFTTVTPVTVSSGSSVYTTQSSIVVVDTPTPVLSTTTEPWTGSSTTTFTTVTPVTVSSGSSVYTTQSSIVVVDTPTPVLSTTTEPWTGSSTTTFTTITPVTVSSGSSVFTTQSSIVVVDTPTPVSNTTTEPWTKSSASLTPLTVTSNSSVLTTPRTVIDTTKTVLSTVTVPCTGSSTSTFTTVTPVTFTSGSSVYTTPSSIVVVATSTLVLTVTEPCTVCSTSTVTFVTPVTVTSGSTVFTTHKSVVSVDTFEASSTPNWSKPRWVTSVSNSAEASTSNAYSTTTSSLSINPGNHTQTVVTVDNPSSAIIVSTSVDRILTSETQPAINSEVLVSSTSTSNEVLQSSAHWDSASHQTNAEFSQAIESSRGSPATKTMPQQSNADQIWSTSAKELPSGPGSVGTTVSTQAVSPTGTYDSESVVSQATAKTDTTGQPEPVQSSSAQGSRSNSVAPSQPSIQTQQTSTSQANSSRGSIAVDTSRRSGFQPANSSQATSIELTNAGSRAIFALKPRNVGLGLILLALI